MCGLTVEYEGNSVLSIRGDPEDPFSKGYVCPKSVALQDIYTDPDRLKFPVKRNGERWDTISWKEAFDFVEEGIKRVQSKYGHDAFVSPCYSQLVRSIAINKKVTNKFVTNIKVIYF